MSFYCHQGIDNNLDGLLVDVENKFSLLGNHNHGKISYLLEDDISLDVESLSNSSCVYDNLNFAAKSQNCQKRRTTLQKRRCSTMDKHNKMRARMRVLYSTRSTSADFEVPKFPKTDEEKNFIRKYIGTNFLFSHATEQNLFKIIHAFEKIEISKDGVIIEENEIGDYFYLIEFGVVQFFIKGSEVGIATTPECFGELALLYSCPRLATCIAKSDCKLWRIDRKTFNHILSNTEINGSAERKALLRRIPFLSSCTDLYLENLAQSMKTQQFSKGESVVIKGESGGTLYVLKEGVVKVHDIHLGGESRVDKYLKTGAYFGELSIVKNEKAMANVTAMTYCEIFTISRDYFDEKESSFFELVIESNYSRMLTDLLSILKPEEYQIKMLSTQVFHAQLDKGTLVHEVESLPKKGLYFVLSGSVKIQVNGEIQEKKIGDYFGIETVLDEVPSINAEIVDDCKVGVLAAEIIANTGLLEHMSKRTQLTKKIMTSSMIERKSFFQTINYSQLRVHSELGKGAFGRVWLTTFSDDEKKEIFALKEMKKQNLIKKNCVPMILREARILTMMDHPFIIDLVNMYQNKTSLFMLFPVMSGGELFQLMEEFSFFSERATKFYSGVILEALSYLHDKNILFRDLKPENVLIDKDGYVKVVDFGFAKQTREKTFTLCGTPLYMAPEIILGQGQDEGVDYWALAVIIFEMISGLTPFFDEGDSQMTLFKKICKVKIDYPDDLEATDEFYDLVSKSFQVDARKRIGAVNGCKEITSHKWYDKLNFVSLREKKLVAPWLPDTEEEQHVLGDGKELKMKSNEVIISDEEQNLFIDFGLIHD